jgi:hypothetical protein
LSFEYPWTKTTQKVSFSNQEQADDIPDITDLDFADDLAIPSDTVANAESLLHAVKEAAAHVGLYYNSSKTEYTSSSLEPIITTLSENTIKLVPDFQYLVLHIMYSEKDFHIRKTLAWSACNKLEKIWKSGLTKQLKVNLFRATVEPIILYGEETWTMNSKMHRRLDGCYTNMLRRIQNMSWKNHHTLSEIYGTIPKLSTRLAERRARFAGHFEQKLKQFLIWYFGKPRPPGN